MADFAGVMNPGSAFHKGKINGWQSSQRENPRGIVPGEMLGSHQKPYDLRDYIFTYYIFLR